MFDILIEAIMNIEIDIHEASKKLNITIENFLDLWEKRILEWD